MTYKVTAQYAGARELPSDSFNDIKKAKEYIATKMQENAALKVKVVYRLYEWDDLLQAFDPSNATMTSSSSQPQDQGSQGQGKGATFRPSPLNTAPRPAGIPHSSFKDEDEKKK